MTDLTRAEMDQPKVGEFCQRMSLWSFAISSSRSGNRHGTACTIAIESGGATDP